MIRHTLTPLPSGGFLLKMTCDGICIQTTDVSHEDAVAMVEVLMANTHKTLPPVTFITSGWNDDANAKEYVKQCFST